MNELLRNKIDNLPERSGVYLMKDKSGQIIYVGKAKILKNRVRQYFQSPKHKDAKVRSMVSHIEDLTYLVTDTETEALMLECNLIKEHRPYYNILMKDDKGYPYIKLTMSENYPRLMITRKRTNDSDRYFGPFTNSRAAHLIVDEINRLYPLQLCEKKTAYGKRIGRVCLNYHLGQCAGCCTGEITAEEYEGYIAEISKILNGKYDILTRRINEAMHRAADSLNFERAAELRDAEAQIRSLFDEQKINHTVLDERDIIGFYVENGTVAVQIFGVREGKLTFTATRYMSIKTDEGEDVLSAFLKQYYYGGSYIPKEILTAYLPEDAEAIEGLLTELSGSKTELRVPKIGEKKRLLEMAERNAKLNVEMKRARSDNEKARRAETLAELAEALCAKSAERIEAYDISHISGELAVGVMEVYSAGQRNAKAQRKFRIKYVEGGDEYASMSEVVFRRLSRAKGELAEHSDAPKFLPLPDIILVDGGAVHVKLVRSLVRDFGFDIAVGGLVKNNRHALRALVVDPDGQERSLSSLPKCSKLLNDISETVHNSAVGYHRAQRSKQMVTSELSAIPHIGKKRVAALLRGFSCIDEIRAADVEALSRIDGMNAQSAKAVYEYYHPEGSAED